MDLSEPLSVRFEVHGFKQFWMHTGLEGMTVEDAQRWIDSMKELDPDWEFRIVKVTREVL